MRGLNDSIGKQKGHLGWIPAFAGMTLLFDPFPVLRWVGIQKSRFVIPHLMRGRNDKSPGDNPIFASPKGEGFPPSPKETLIGR